MSLVCETTPLTNDTGNTVNQYRSVTSNISNVDREGYSGELTTAENTSGASYRRNIINNYNNNHQSNGIQLRMDNSRQILFKITLDAGVLLLIGLPILAFFIWGEPYRRGFFCDDESLHHPFHESTVRNWMLYLVGILLPIGLFLTTEIIRSKLSSEKDLARSKLRLFGFEIPTWSINSYKIIGIFGFGAASSQLITDIGKYTIGRLRPHFFSVCQPLMPDGSDCSNPINIGKYIMDFTCTGYGSSERMLKEMRLSFPSGHASFSAFTMIFCMIYLQARMTWRGSKLIKHFLQFLLLLLTWYTALTRVSDYKHHWSDVLGGAVIGTFTALIVTSFVSGFFVNLKPQEPIIPLTRYELGTPSPPATNGLPPGS